MNRTQKEEFVGNLRADLAQAKSLVLATHVGIDANTINTLRAEFRKQNVEYRVVKNTLTRLAIADTDMEPITEHLKGPIALAFSHEDAISPAKVLKEFGKDHEKLVVHAGFLEGRVLDAEGVKQLADMPSKEELQAKLLGLMQAVPSKFLRTLNAPAQKMAMLLKAREQQQAA